MNADGRDTGKPFSGTVLGRPWRWLDERYQLDDIVDLVRHKEVPVGAHALIWYYFGGITLFFFMIQIVTGILLLMYYEAGENTSYESLKYIVSRVPFGWLVRSVHCWSAHLMVISALIHMFSVFFLKAYKKPRELTWLTGMGLLSLALGFGFSGYLLPWNELSYFATAVGTDSVKSIPLIGGWALEVLRGGEEVTIRTLHRFFALHVCALPLLTFALIGVHLLFIQRQGMARPPEVSRGETVDLGGMRFFPNFALRDLLLWVVALNILALLALVFPYGPGIPGMEWELGEKADQLKPAYPGIKPEWYFLWVYQLLKEFPPHLLGMEGPQACMLVVTLMMLAWIAVPLLDRSSQRGKSSPAFTDFGVGVILFLALLTLKAWDIGVSVLPGEDAAARPELVHAINRNAAGIVVALGALVSLLRRVMHGTRQFIFTGIALFLAALHGFFGLPFLSALGISMLPFAGSVFILSRRARMISVLIMAAFVIDRGLPVLHAASEPAAVPEESSQVFEQDWPADVKALMGPADDTGPAVSADAQAFFRRLPSHAQTMLFNAIANGLVSSRQQLDGLLSLGLDDRSMELVLGDNCVLCHTNPDMQSEKSLFRVDAAGSDRSREEASHMDLSQVVADVHFRKGLMCAGCHGGSPSDLDMNDEIYRRWPAAEARAADRTWIPDFCAARCHSNPELMRRYNPALPVDQHMKYRESRHGRLLLDEKDSKAAQCVSCHGVHGIRGPDSPVSSVNAANIPATCGHCHSNPEYMKGYTLADGKTQIPTDQLQLYRSSIHGKALLEEHDMGAPACNDCHGNHAALPPEVSHVAQVCRTCHVVNGSLFDGSAHKQAFLKHEWPECETCHGKHEIQAASDEMLAPTAAGGICDSCHEKYGKPECFDTTRFFYRGLVTLRNAKDEIDAEADELAEMGMQVDDLRFGASGLEDQLLQTRSLIHSFNRSDFAQPYEAGQKSVVELKGEIARMRQELTYRRRWLLISTLVITIFAVLLFFRIRMADRTGGYRQPVTRAGARRGEGDP